MLGVTVRQIIDEYRKLTPEEQEQVRGELKQPNSVSDSGVRHADYDEAMRVADKILTKHTDLFRKLAQ